MAHDLTFWQDGDRFVIGRASWQTARSRTYIVADAYSRCELRQQMAFWAAQPLNEIEAAKRASETPYRFEAACDAGAFGVAW